MSVYHDWLFRRAAAEQVRRPRWIGASARGGLSVKKTANRFLRSRAACTSRCDSRDGMAPFAVVETFGGSYGGREKDGQRGPSPPEVNGERRGKKRPRWDARCRTL